MNDLLVEEKRFYERFWALHNDPVLVAIVKQFGIEVFRRSSVLEGFEAFIKQHGFSGKRCVEIGTCKGLTALVLARYFDDVTTIDTVPDPQRRQIAHHCGIYNVHFVTVADNAAKAQAVAAMSFDAAFVDGDHTHDTQTDFALVRHCGRVLFHEYWPAQPAVMKLVDGLRGNGAVLTNGKFALWTASSPRNG